MSPLERLAAALRAHPLGVDAGLAVLVWFCTVLLTAGLFGTADPAVLGVLAGVGLAAAVSALVGTDSPVPLEGLAVPLSAVVAGLAVGTVTTLVAALGPARAATRVAPLAALRPADPAPLRSRGGLVRLVTGLVLLLGGAALMAAGVVVADVYPSLAGGAASFLGVVLLAPPSPDCWPRCCRRGGPPAPHRGPPSRPSDLPRSWRRDHGPPRIRGRGAMIVREGVSR